MTEELISKTGLKIEFGLTDKDIKELELVKTARNRMKSGYDILLYSKDQARKLTIEKYGSVEARLSEKTQRSQKVKNTKTNRIQTRTTELTDELNKRGLQLRSDSRLCDGYINGNKNFSLKYVVDTMEEMAWYFNFTDYEDCRDKWIEGELDYRGRFDPDEASDCAKSEALHKWAEKNNSLNGAPPTLHNEIQRIWAVQKSEKERLEAKTFKNKLHQIRKAVNSVPEID